MTGLLSAGDPSSSKTHDSGAGTVGSSIMVRSLQATSVPTESFHRLREYFTFSPLTAAPIDVRSISPSCPGGRSMDRFS